MTKSINETESLAAPNGSAGDGIAGFSPLLGNGKKKSRREMLDDRVDSMRKDAGRGVSGNKNPLNNTFNNGNKELAKKNSVTAIRNSFDKLTKQKKKKGLREIVER